MGLNTQIKVGVSLSERFIFLGKIYWSSKCPSYSISEQQIFP